MSAPYAHFTRAAWARHEALAPEGLAAEELAAVLAEANAVSEGEVTEVFQPLARLIQRAREASARRPYLLGVAGSVAAGKTTFAAVLGAVLSRGDGRPSVRRISTDCFLHPNRILEERGLLTRKGFPESYDMPRLLAFVEALRAGREEVRAPVYSHRVYDIVEGEATVIRRPDVVIIEGLNTLDEALSLDFSIYVDADERHLVAWYVGRFLSLRDAATRDPASYFYRFTALSTEDAITLATHVWAEINGKNLREHILPARERARVIVQKGEDHAVFQVSVREGSFSQ